MATQRRTRGNTPRFAPAPGEEALARDAGLNQEAPPEPPLQGAELLTSTLLHNAGFSHGFPTRRGGVSEPPFDTLNFRRGPGETSGHVTENLRRLAVAVPFDASELHTVDQVHGSRVLVVPPDTPPSLDRNEADAVVVGGGHAAGVRVADCVPILVGDMISGKVAAIHAGWRGIAQGVIGAALAALGDSRSTRVAAIGPCIGSCCFEVGRDVADEIARAAFDADVVRSRAGEKAWVDLRAAARAQLRAHGLPDHDIEDVPGCTRCDKRRFFSHRRDGEKSGRHLAVIRARPA